MFKFVITAMLLAMAASQCVFTPTECQCSEQQSGNLCMRYASGITGSLQCEAYTCGSGYACDCAGTQMCDVTDCTSVRDVYRPTGSGPTAVGDIASCEQASQVQCMTPRVGGAGVMSSPSPLPNPRLPGQPCDVTNTCTAGTTCDCQGICHTDVSLDITAVGDDSVAFWACGTKLGVTAGMGVRKTWRYDGPCSDMYFYATNNNWKTGITLAIEDRSTATMYPSKTDGSSLASIVGVNVPNTEFFADPEYDFSAWVNAVSSADHQVRQPWIDMLTEFGSEAWSYKATDQPGSDLVNSWYKVTLPFCT